VSYPSICLHFRSLGVHIRESFHHVLELNLPFNLLQHVLCINDLITINTLHQTIYSRIEEERNRVSSLRCGTFSLRRPDLVESGYSSISTEFRRQITNIDDDATRHIGCWNLVTVVVPEFKSTSLVLMKKSENSGMWSAY
jgi:hypothetical protein